MSWKEIHSHAFKLQTAIWNTANKHRTALGGDIGGGFVSNYVVIEHLSHNIRCKLSGRVVQILGAFLASEKVQQFWQQKYRYLAITERRPSMLVGVCLEVSQGAVCWVWNVGYRGNSKGKVHLISGSVLVPVDRGLEDRQAARRIVKHGHAFTVHLSVRVDFAVI